LEPTCYQWFYIKNSRHAHLNISEKDKVENCNQIIVNKVTHGFFLFNPYNLHPISHLTNTPDQEDNATEIRIE